MVDGRGGGLERAGPAAEDGDCPRTITTDRHARYERGTWFFGTENHEVATMGGASSERRWLRSNVLSKHRY